MVNAAEELAISVFVMSWILCMSNYQSAKKSMCTFFGGHRVFSTHLRISLQDGRGKLDQKDRLFVAIVYYGVRTSPEQQTTGRRRRGGRVIFSILERYGVGRDAGRKASSFQNTRENARNVRINGKSTKVGWDAHVRATTMRTDRQTGDSIIDIEIQQTTKSRRR
jgi:hypothetical protein